MPENFRPKPVCYPVVGNGRLFEFRVPFVPGIRLLTDLVFIVSID